MFRRRPPRRPMRPRRPGFRPGGRRPPPELIHAHQLLENGNYQEAAELFEKIAHSAESRGGPRAPQFYLQAGRARILARQNETGLAHLKLALSLFTEKANWQYLHRAGTRVINELNQRGLTTEAKEIEQFLENNLPKGFEPLKVTSASKKVVLPTHCPSCGGAIRSDEVDWIDEITAECAYCGSPVREDNA